MCDMCDNRYKELQEKLDVANFNINNISTAIKELEENQLILAEWVNNIEDRVLLIKK